jgi:hypothetical protein
MSCAPKSGGPAKCTALPQTQCGLKGQHCRAIAAPRRRRRRRVGLGEISKTRRLHRGAHSAGEGGGALCRRRRRRAAERSAEAKARRCGSAAHAISLPAVGGVSSHTAPMERPSSVGTTGTCTYRPAPWRVRSAMHTTSCCCAPAVGRPGAPTATAQCCAAATGGKATAEFLLDWVRFCGGGLKGTMRRMRSLSLRSELSADPPVSTMPSSLHWPGTGPALARRWPGTSPALAWHWPGTGLALARHWPGSHAAATRQ